MPIYMVLLNNNSEVTVKYGEAPLTTYKFSQETKSAKSYALDATVISANSAEEIKSAIEQKVADGKRSAHKTQPRF